MSGSVRQSIRPSLRERSIRPFSYRALGIGVSLRDSVISSLFGASEQGALYDPSDLSTLFQDDAGTTPVTADGQPVGLVLDLSQGLVRGPELAPNTGTDYTEFPYTSETPPAELQNTASGVRVLSPDGSFVAFGFNNLTNGTRYEITYTLELVSGQIQFRATPSEDFGIPGTYARTVIVDTEAAGSIIRWARLGASTDAFVRDISVRKLPGNHATQATAAARPLYKTDGALHWLLFDNVDDFLVVNGSFSAIGVSGICVAGYEITVFGSNNQAILFTNGGVNPPWIGVSQPGNAGSIFSGVGSPTMEVNRVSVATRGDFHTAIASGLAVITAKSLDFDVNGMATPELGGYNVSGYQIGGNITSLVVAPTPSDIALVESWVAEKSGVTL